MSGQERQEEREPLLRERQDSGTYHSIEPPEEEDITAQIETIKENLSFRVVVISLASILTCLFVTAIDGSLFITLLNDVSTAFSSSDLSFWIGTSYMLSSCIMSPIYARLNDIVGRKNALLCAVTLFLAGTALCAVASSMLGLIAARFLAGMGGGGIQTCVAVILGDLIPLRKRAIYHAVAQVVFSLGTASGGPIGGLLNDWLGWRVAIATQVPILALALFLITFVLQLPDFPKTKEQKERETQESEFSILQLLRKRIDITGCILLTATCMTLMLGLSFLSSANLPFSDVQVWANLLSSAVLFVILLWYEAIIASEPIIPLKLLKNRMVSCVVAYYFFQSVSLGLMFYIPVYFRSVLLQSASETGVHFISLSISTTLGSFFSGGLIARTGRYKNFMLFSSVMVLFAPIYLSTWSEKSIPSKFSQNLILAPLGFGGAAMSTMLVVCVLAACQRESQATALGLVYLSRSLGSIVGIAAFGAQIQYVLTAELTKHITGPNAIELIDKIRKNASVIISLPDDIKAIALRAYSFAFQVLNIGVAVVVFIGLLIVLPMKEIPVGGAKKPAAEPASSTSDDAEVADGQREEEAGIVSNKP